MSQTLEFVNPGGNLTLDESEIVAKNLDKITTGIGDARVEVPQNDAIIPYVQRQDRINYSIDGTVEFTGYAVGFSGNERTGKWTLRLDGIGKRLEETRPDYDALGGNLVYTNTRLDDAIEDYWSRTPFSATVTDQVPETIATGELIQDADTTTEWQNTVTLADTDPLVIQNGNLELAQSAFTTEGEDETTSSGDSAFSNSAFSGGFARGFDETGPAVVGSFIEWDFTPQYDIAAEDVEVAVRDDASDPCGVEWTLNGNVIDTLAASATSISLSWTEVGDGEYSLGDGYTGGDLQAGVTYTLRAEVTDISAGEDYIVDVVAPYDGRFSYNFDNDNGGSDGYLDGPELYPASVDADTNTVDTAYNIESATVTTTWDDTSNNQAIAASNDNGSTFLTSNNTAINTFTFGSSGRQAVTRFTLGRYGSRTTATPQQGFNGQLIQDYTLEVDLTNLTVIDRLELTRDHFSNLKQLHDYGDFLWVIEHGSGDLDTLTVSSFQRGEETRTAPAAFSDTENIMPEVAAENYFNSVYVEGALQDDGTRPTGTVKSDSAIAEDGREITPGVLRDQSISTESGAQFRANALLASALSNNELRGSISTYPAYVQPGYSYSVDFGEGAKEKTLERVSITETAGDVSADYEFVVKEELAETIDRLKREGRNLGNQV